VEEKKDLWNLVRKKLKKDVRNDDEELVTLVENETDIKFEEQLPKRPKNSKEEYAENDLRKKIRNYIKSDKTLLNQGIFSGFVYIFVIMTLLGIIMIPGSVTAAIGGYFGGRKSGDPARALTAAMLPFLIIATISIIVSIGALPPGSGPNDLSENVGDFLGYTPDKDSIGPISKMPDSNSSVFLSVVTFAFIGGLVETEKRKKLSVN